MCVWVAGHELQLAEDVFKLQHLLECNILRHREELEEITNAAVKEEQIETKLAAIESDWSALNLVGLEQPCRSERHICLGQSGVAAPVCWLVMASKAHSMWEESATRVSTHVCSFSAVM